MSLAGRHLDILLVDDDLGDCRLVEETLGAGKHVARLHVVHDGDEALAYLRHQGDHKKAKRPDLVLLDLNMPKKDGFETLQEIRADKRLADLVVIVLTTSVDDKDVARAYRLGANCFVSKPTRIEDFAKAMRAIEDFWSITARTARPD